MRYFKAILAFALAAIMLILAWLMPTYLRSIDSDVVKLAGRDTTTLVDKGLGMIELEQYGPANLLSIAATRAKLPRSEVLESAVRRYAKENPVLVPWGGNDPFISQILIREGKAGFAGSSNALQTMLPRSSRLALLNSLNGSRRPGVQEIIKNRLLTNTVHFPPVRTAAGQPLEAAILMAALLHQSDVLSAGLRRELESAVVAANVGKGTQKAELFYLDLLSMARRLDWVQMTTIIRSFNSFKEVESFVNMMTRSAEQLPQLYSAVVLASSSKLVIDYLTAFGIKSLSDVEFAMANGEGALRLLLNSDLRMHSEPYRKVLVDRTPFDNIYFGFLGIASKMPVAGVYFKYLFVLIGGYLFAGGLGCLLPRASDFEQSLKLKNFGVARQTVVAVLLVLVTVVLAEPSLFDEHQAEQPLPRWKFPMVKTSVVAQITKPIQSFMNQITIASLVGFLVIQGILYIISLLRIAEIRKQPVSSDLKMRLLENEENMFDAGLYVGLGGTVLSLVFIAMNIVGPGLMAAYSSTLFGILFVAILKICHVRPFRRRLILETEFKG